MTCDVCQADLAAEQRAQVNGVNCHVIECFARALRSAKHPIEVGLEESMRPALAYFAGQTFFEVISGATPAKPKKKKKPEASH